MKKHLFRSVSLIGVAATAVLAAGCVANPPSSGLQNPAAGCYDSAASFEADIYYSGTPDVLDNIEFRADLDGSCSGVPAGKGTLVLASDHVGADAKCATFGRQGSYSASASPDPYLYPMPATAWICTTN